MMVKQLEKRFTEFVIPLLDKRLRFPMLKFWMGKSN